MAGGTMKMDNFGACFREGDGMLRSISSPQLAKKRQFSTQNLLRAAAEGNVAVVRQLALAADAELDGCRAYDRYGAGPFQVVAAAEHFLPVERERIVKHLHELPKLRGAAEKARAKKVPPSKVGGPPPLLRGDLTVRKAPGTRCRASAMPNTDGYAADAIDDRGSSGEESGNGSGSGSASMNISHHATGRITSDGVVYAEAGKEQKFTLGDRVQVRDSTALAFRSGTVVSLNPTRVKKDGPSHSRQGHSYRQIVPESQGAQGVSALAGPHHGATTVAEIPNGDIATCDGECVGDFVKLRWQGKEVWVDRRDVGVRPPGRRLGAGSATASQTLRDATATQNKKRARTATKDARDGDSAADDSDNDSRSGDGVGATVSAEQAPLSLKTLRGRDLAMQMAMTRLTTTVDHHDTALNAAFRNPALLRAPPETAQRALPAMTATLRSEALAVQAATKNPRLLNFEAHKFRNVVPMLNVLLGGEEEAAYAIGARPELLEVKFPQQLKETVQNVADCVCSMNDAVWLVVQTLVPPSVVLTTRPHSLEAVVGEYTRCKGLRVDGKPVYRKPASTMLKQFGASAKDFYFIYSNKGPSGKPCWTVTPAFDATQHKNGSAKARVGSKQVAKGAISEAVAKASSLRMSPDQVPLGGFSFKLGSVAGSEQPDWTVDQYAKVSDAGRQRGQPLLLLAPSTVRRSYDLLTEALGIFWREATPDGCSLPGSRLVGCMRSEDRVHSNGRWRVQSLGDFTLKNGYTYIRLPAAEGGRDQTTDGASSPASPAAMPPPAVLSLVAWEPIIVHLLYLGTPLGDTDGKDAPPEPEPAAKGGAKGAKGAKDEAAAPSAALLMSPNQHEEVLLKDGWWRPDNESVRLPTLSFSKEATDETAGASPDLEALEGVTVAPVVEQVFVRGYTRSSATGLCQVPVPCNAEGPPLVFVKSAVTATSFREGRACEVVKAKPQESIYFDISAPEEPPPAQAEPVPAKGGKGKDVVADEPPLPPPPPLVIKSAGDLGYQSGFFFRAPATELTCDESQIQMRLDTSDRIKVVIAWLETPQPPTDAGEDNSGSKETSGAGADEETSSALSPAQAAREPPPLPSWVKKEGWKKIEPRLPVNLIAYGDQLVTADRFATKEFNNEIVTIRGSGPELTCLVFFVPHGAARPNVLRNLLLDEPNLLGAERALALFTRRVRSELGDVVARRTVMDRRAEWSELLQVASEKDVHAWIYERKIEAFERILLDPDTWTSPPAGSSEAAAGAKRLSVSVMEARSLVTSKFTGDGSWCYCSVKRAKGCTRPSFKTRQLKTVNPEWYETHELSSWQPGEALEFRICDNGSCAERLGTPVDCTNECRVEIASERFYPDCFEGELDIARVAHLQKLRVSMIRLKNVDFSSDKLLYCECSVHHLGKSSKKTVCQTKTTAGSMTPAWQCKDNTHEINDWKLGERLEFVIFNKVHLGSQFLGKAVLPSERFFPNGFEGDVPVECEGMPHAMLQVCVLPAGVKNSGTAGAGMPKLRLRIQVIENARTMVVECPDLANITAPALATSCTALKKGLGGNAPALQVASRWPHVLAEEPTVFLHALAVLSEVFGEGRAQGWATQFPYLLSRGKQIENVFARTKELYPLIYVERLCTRTDGEWVNWRQMVDEPENVVTGWLGRIAAEERSLTCENRVRSFGNSALGKG
jgi:hypothetical protein